MKWKDKLLNLSDGYSKLHIVYRSLDQFLEGIDNRDKISENIFKTGVPIVGKSNFHEIISRFDTRERKQLNEIKWNYEEGKLTGKMIYRN